MRVLLGTTARARFPRAAFVFSAQASRSSNRRRVALVAPRCHKAQDRLPAGNPQDLGTSNHPNTIHTHKINLIPPKHYLLPNQSLALLLLCVSVLLLPAVVAVCRVLLAAPACPCPACCPCPVRRACLVRVRPRASRRVARPGLLPVSLSWIPSALASRLSREPRL